MTGLFDHRNRTRNADTRRVYAAYEIAHTVADFIAAISFLVGSVLFLWPVYETSAIWFFIVGSFFFCLKPSLRLAREVQLWRMGRLAKLAQRAGE
ncbi:YrhK family protein [Roseovarius sp. D22-M7]|uniref:YrhK family protein n=1 Tax=Roseovarius sp. D22-M7 TaxID=3127116 RepID=UPI00300F8C24